MTRRLRHGAILRLAGPVLLAGLAPGAPTVAAPDATDAFIAPHSEMLLTRSLRRELPDGKEVVATRSYAVRFARDAQGLRVDGRLIDVTIEAPPSLRALAEIERDRPDPALFPIRLDPAGMIVGGPPAHTDAAIDRAADLATREIGASGLVASDISQAQAFIGQVRGHPAASQWPTDLFRPTAAHRSETREVPQPGGRTGRVTVEIAAQSAGSTGLLNSLERTVTTDLAGDRRVTRERWTLDRAAGNSER